MLKEKQADIFWFVYTNAKVYAALYFYVKYIHNTNGALYANIFLFNC